MRLKCLSEGKYNTLYLCGHKIVGKSVRSILIQTLLLRVTLKEASKGTVVSYQNGSFSSK